MQVVVLRAKIKWMREVIVRCLKKQPFTDFHNDVSKIFEIIELSKMLSDREVQNGGYRAAVKELSSTITSNL